VAFLVQLIESNAAFHSQRSHNNTFLFRYLYADEGSHKHGVECKSSVSLGVISVVHMFTPEVRKVK
jgi:hypothetical protein